MNSFIKVFTISMLAVLLYHPKTEGRVHINVGVGMTYAEPVYVERSPYARGCRSCPRYVRRVPPVYAYPHTVYYGPPGVIYEEVYPYPPYCDGCRHHRYW